MNLQYFPDWSVYLETFEGRLVIIYCLLVYAQGLKRISCLEISVLSLFCVNKEIQEEMSIILEVRASVIVRIDVHMNMCLILNYYRERAVWIYEYKNSIVNGKRDREITYCYFNFNFMIKRQICFTEITNLLQFTVDFRKSHRQPQFELDCFHPVVHMWQIY